MNNIRISIDFETINIDAGTLKARIVYAILLGTLNLEDNHKESCEADPNSVTVQTID